MGAVEARPREPGVLSPGALPLELDALRSAVTAIPRRQDLDWRRGTCSGGGLGALRAPGVGLGGWISACLLVWQPGDPSQNPSGDTAEELSQWWTHTNTEKASAEVTVLPYTSSRQRWTEPFSCTSETALSTGEPAPPSSAGLKCKRGPPSFGPLVRAAPTSGAAQPAQPLSSLFSSGPAEHGARLHTASPLARGPR